MTAAALPAPAYAEPDTPRPLTSADIDALLQYPPGKFRRDRVRKRLYDKGFPHPYEPGKWSSTAVLDWLRQVGTNRAAVPPPNPRQKKRRRQHAPSGYAPV
jgi:hypothetical protein